MNKDKQVIVNPRKKRKRGPVTLYTPKTVEHLLNALRAGLAHNQACQACGISRRTFNNWREQYPDFELRVNAARDEARQNALQDIKTAGKKDWRALAVWLKLAFPEYRSGGPTFNVSANAQAGVLCTEEQRQEIIAMRAKLLSRPGGYQRAIEHSVGIPADSERAGSSDLTTDGEYVKVEESERP